LELFSWKRNSLVLTHQRIKKRNNMQEYGIWKKDKKESNTVTRVEQSRESHTATAEY
jgi:hypothetical protein